MAPDPAAPADRLVGIPGVPAAFADRAHALLARVGDTPEELTATLDAAAALVAADPAWSTSAPGGGVSINPCLRGGARDSVW